MGDVSSTLLSSTTTSSTTEKENQQSNTLSSTTTTTTTVPSYRQLIQFIGTTILIWLSEPLLSLVDTTVVGLTQRDSAVVQLAALGPATTLCDSLLFSTYFLAISTTNQIAASWATKDYKRLMRITSQVLGVAAVLGGIVMAIVFGFGAPLLTRMAGQSASPELLYHATRYTYIRGSAAMASVVGMVCQSFCLATLDTQTPARAVAVASLLNIVGDLALSPRWGVQGAAVATAVSTFASAGLLLRAVSKQLQQWNILANQQQQDETNAAQPPSSETGLTTQKDDVDDSVAPIMLPVEQVRPEEKMMANFTTSFSSQEEEQPAEEETVEAEPVVAASIDVSATTTTTTTPNDPNTKVQLFSLPNRQDLVQLLALAGPISFVIWAKVACYGAMTLRSTEFGVVPLATHAIMMRVFFFFSSMGDSVSQAAQSFLPGTLYPQPQPRQFQNIFQKLLVVAATIGIINSQCSMAILKHAGQFLTSDANIIQLMREQSTNFGLALLLHPMIIVLEGTVIASRDFTTLVATYAVTLGVHFSLLKFASATFPAVWRTFLLFQGIRMANFSVRVWRKQLRMRREQRSVQAQDAN
eukprot:CAMPEP_0172446148 /NCGR_PEP_ID=MMETSP1065-20121228/5808_1 /TAXON_ID=265537 /ORGANISM="Amphiprora paludosa, Strain CCMP125" /LENGTH=583 /DNA_ID=CAMNT_0013197197 /DNA_START=368 /DNA_END=2119 /DNA_ORIENTATION=-